MKKLQKTSNTIALDEQQKPNSKKLIIETLLNKNNYKKTFDMFINQLLFENTGCYYYFITIKVTEINNILGELTNALDGVSLLDNFLFYFINHISIKHNSNIQIFISFQNLINNNCRIQKNLILHFFEQYTYNITIVECDSMKKQLNCIKKIIEPMVQNEIKTYLIINTNWDFLFWKFINFLENNNEIFKIPLLIQKITLPNPQEFLSIQKNQNKKLLSINQLIHLFRIYFYDQKLWLHDKILYEDIINTKIAIRPIEKINNFENLYEKIIQWAIKTYTTTFFGFDFLNLKVFYLQNFYNKLLKKKIAITKPIEVTFDIIEFFNGYYIMSTNKFLKREKIIGYCKPDVVLFEQKLLNNRIKTIVFIDKNYKKKLVPQTWIKLILKKNPKIKLYNLLMEFSQYFNSELIIKQKTQLIETLINGPEISLKTTIAISLIIKYYCVKKPNLINKYIKLDFNKITKRNYNLMQQLYNEIPLLLVYCNKINKKNLICNKRYSKKHLELLIAN